MGCTLHPRFHHTIRDALQYITSITWPSDHPYLSTFSLILHRTYTLLTSHLFIHCIFRNQLAKRLLNQRSASDEMERLMIGKLKLRCGYRYDII